MVYIINDKEKIVGESQAMREVIDKIKKLKDFTIPVLITGETGTGKYLVAKALHSTGKRRQYPYHSLNCGALSETLIEDELFGHVKGAYTDARVERKGFFEVCEGGSLNLDEVTMLSESSQSKLLTIVEYGYFYRIGNATQVPSNVRVIASTNEDTNKLRRDLYHRLAVGMIKVPPLRARKEDIPLLMRHFAQMYVEGSYFDSSDEALFALYDWTGNVRQLKHAVERIVLLMEDKMSVLEQMINENGKPKDEDFVPRHLDDIEREHIERTLYHFKGNRTHSADALKITVRTVRNKIREYHL